MSERVTRLMMDNAMDYLAELLGVTFHKYGETAFAKPGDITYESSPTKNSRYFFGIYQYVTAWPTNEQVLGVFRPYGLLSHSRRELHDHVRFAATVIYDHRRITEA